MTLKSRNSEVKCTIYDPKKLEMTHLYQKNNLQNKMFNVIENENYF